MRAPVGSLWEAGKVVAERDGLAEVRRWRCTANRGGRHAGAMCLAWTRGVALGRDSAERRKLSLASQKDGGHVRIRREISVMEEEDSETDVERSSGGETRRILRRRKQKNN